MTRLCRVFFFQAEDGIRDYKVTGVQTCALPISQPRHALGLAPRERTGGGRPPRAPGRGPASRRCASRQGGAARRHRKRGRSEEHTSELQSPCNLVCRLLLEKKKNMSRDTTKLWRGS